MKRVPSVDTTMAAPLPRRSDAILTLQPMPNRAAPSVATWTWAIPPRTASGITPVLRSATQARNPRTKRGTSGARRVTLERDGDVDPLQHADDGHDRRQHDDTGELDDDGDCDDGRPGGAGGSHHLAHLVDARPRPLAELQSGEPQGPLEQGKQDQRQGPEERHHRDRDGDVLLVAAQRSPPSPRWPRRRRWRCRCRSAGSRAGLRPIRRPSQVVKTRVPTRLTATTAITGRPSAADGARRRPRTRAGRCRPAAAAWSPARAAASRVRGSSPRFAAATPRPIDQVRTPTGGRAGDRATPHRGRAPGRRNPALR